MSAAAKLEALLKRVQTNRLRPRALAAVPASRVPSEPPTVEYPLDLGADAVTPPRGLRTPVPASRPVRTQDTPARPPQPTPLEMAVFGEAELERRPTAPFEAQREPLHAVPVEVERFEAAPIEVALEPDAAAPFEARLVPVEAAPVEAAPVEAAPVEAAPVEAALVEAELVEVVLVDAELADAEIIEVGLEPVAAALVEGPLEPLPTEVEVALEAAPPAPVEGKAIKPTSVLPPSRPIVHLASEPHAPERVTFGGLLRRTLALRPR